MPTLAVGELRQAGSTDAELREALGLGEDEELNDDMVVAPVSVDKGL